MYGFREGGISRLAGARGGESGVLEVDIDAGGAGRRCQSAAVGCCQEAVETEVALLALITLALLLDFALCNP